MIEIANEMARQNYGKKITFCLIWLKDRAKSWFWIDRILTVDSSTLCDLRLLMRGLGMTQWITLIALQAWSYELDP